MSFIRLCVTALIAIVVLTNCSDPVKPPRPGEVVLVLSTPKGDDGAVLFDLVGPAPIDEIEPVHAEHLLFHRMVGDTVRVAIFGHLRGGPLVRLTIPDIKQAAEYQAEVLEVADTLNALRRSLTGVSLDADD